MKHSTLAPVSVLLFAVGCASVPEKGRLLTDFNFSDPTVWRADDGRYYAVATGLKPFLVSDDLFTWRDSGMSVVDDTVFASLDELAPGKHDGCGCAGIWAPDVVKIGNRWILTLSLHVSAQKACIVSLVSDVAEGPYKDPKLLVDGPSVRIADAIDPEIVVDGGKTYLFFGSLDGIHRLELAPDARSPKVGAAPVHVAGERSGFRMERRQKDRRTHFEGVYLYRRDGWWYLFASGGRYNDHSYRIVVGRSRTLEGTFVDRKGRAMTEGCAETVLSSGAGDRFFGPGHNGEIFEADGRLWMFYHVHDRTLQYEGSYIPRPMAIQEIKWGEDDWPCFEGGKPQLDE